MPTVSPSSAIKIVFAKIASSFLSSTDQHLIGEFDQPRMVAMCRQPTASQVVLRYDPRQPSACLVGFRLFPS